MFIKYVDAGWMDRQGVFGSPQMHDKPNVFCRSSYPWGKVISKILQKTEDLMLALKEVDNQRKGQRSIPEREKNCLIIDAEWGYMCM